MIYNVIKADMMTALKEKRNEDKEVLSFLYSQMKNKAIELRVTELEDKDALNVIQKFIKSLTEEKEAFQKAGRSDKVSVFNKQLELINKYLPKQLSEDDIINIINSLSDKSIPNVMRHFKNNFSGQVDMQLVNKLLRSIS